MYAIMSAEDAVREIKSGDTIGLNVFMALNHPEILYGALYNRFKTEHAPCDLQLFCTAGFGGWDDESFLEPLVAAGAVKSVVASHFNSTPVTKRLLAANEIEGYCLPLGVMSHMLRGSVEGRRGILSSVGLNLFVDPRREGAGINARSKAEWVSLVEFEGEEQLYYKTPELNIAFIRGTTCDPSGNITFEQECLTADALAMAQAVRRNGGKVIVQVQQLSGAYSRPRNVVIPGAFVDIVVVAPEQRQTLAPGYNPTFSGDMHVPPAHMNYWTGILQSSKNAAQDISRNIVGALIGARASKELSEGDIINIGIGIPEHVGPAAANAKMLDRVTLTVESGGIGGLPAPGVHFGAAIGADMFTDMASLFDFYNGGGLDVCFMGSFETDMAGNVNSHNIEGHFSGIGGFANITFASKKVVFCGSFTAGGLAVSYENGRLTIEKEGNTPKFVKQVSSYSFSALNAARMRQKVIYVTERCVFELSGGKLVLTELADGIDLRRDVLDRLPEAVEVAANLKTMDFSNFRGFTVQSNA